MRVAVFGDINLDLVVGIDSLPGPGEEVFATSTRVGLGGSAANTAVVLARLDVPTLIVAQVGDDAFGTMARSELESVGVDTSRVTTSRAAPTGLNLVTVAHDGERSMIGARGANAALVDSAEWVADCDWIHLSGYSFLTDPQATSARTVLAAAKAAGLPVSVDIPAGVGTSLGPKLIDDLAGCHLVASGLPGIEAIAGSPEGMVELGVTTVAVTAGAEACRLVDAGDTVKLTPPIVATVDTTGAGDSFIAGLVKAQLAGLEPGPALALASALGAAATTHRGAGLSLGDRDRVRRLLDEGTWPDAPPEWLAQAARVLG